MQSSNGFSTSYLSSFHHHTVLTNLQPATQYYYVAGDATGGFSNEFSFVTAPITVDEQVVTRIYYIIQFCYVLSPSLM